jgi:hypothetical protein
MIMFLSLHAQNFACSSKLAERGSEGKLLNELGDAVLGASISLTYVVLSYIKTL